MRFSVHGYCNNNAIVVPLHTLDAIGIKCGEQCWGIWVSPRGGYKPPGAPKEEGSVGRHLPHLVVSRVHPDKWPDCVRIEAKISNKSGTTTKLLSALAGHNINLLDANVVPTGYNYGIFSGFGYIVSKSSNHDWKSQFGTARGVLGVGTEDAKTRTVQAVGMAMLRKIAEIRASIIQANMGSEGSFLDSRIVSGGYEPWHIEYPELVELLNTPPANSGAVREVANVVHNILKKDGNKYNKKYQADRVEKYQAGGGANDESAYYYKHVIEDIWRSHWEEPIEIVASTLLCHLRLWAMTSKDEEMPTDVPIYKFRCEADNNGQLLIRIDGDGDNSLVFPPRCNMGDGPIFDKVAKVTAAVHVRNQFVRFRFFRKEFVDTFTRRVTVPYNYKAGPPVGLLEAVLGGIDKGNGKVTVEWVNNSVSEASLESECGKIEIIYSVKGCKALDDSEKTNTKKAIEQSIKNSGLDDITYPDDIQVAGW